MKFDVVICNQGNRTFKKVNFLNGDDCIVGTPKGSHTDEDISVIYPEDREVTPYPSIEPGKVLYPVRVGDTITVNKKVNGTYYLNAYRVIAFTSTEVICGPVE